MNMYSAIEPASLQATVFPFNKNTVDAKDCNEIDELTTLDPLGERIWSIVSTLFQTNAEITI